MKRVFHNIVVISLRVRPCWNFTGAGGFNWFYSAGASLRFFEEAPARGMDVTAALLMNGESPDYCIKYAAAHKIAARFKTERQEAGYLKNIFANAYLKGIVERNRIRNGDELGTPADIPASSIGAPANPAKISNALASECHTACTNKTISKHIDYLAGTFLIFKANRYGIKGIKYIGADLKYYFTDIELRNAGLNFRRREPAHIMENIVYNELLIRGYNVDTGVVGIYAKDKDGGRSRKQLEVDFAANQGSQRYYIQAAI